MKSELIDIQSHFEVLTQRDLICLFIQAPLSFRINKQN